MSKRSTVKGDTIKGNTHFTLAQSTSKPLDVNKMVGNNVSNNNKKNKNKNK